MLFFIKRDLMNFESILPILPKTSKKNNIKKHASKMEKNCVAPAALLTHSDSNGKVQSHLPLFGILL